MEHGSELRVVIAGGGTGGHLYPGLAVARALIARVPGARVTFAGTSRGLEARVVPREGFELDVIRSGGLKGKSLADRAKGVGLLPMSLVDAWGVVARRRPHVVIGVGGYSSGPLVLMAAMRGVPTMLIEQNAVPGLTNRLLAPVVRAAAVTYETTKAYFGNRAFVSGNPVRAEFFDRVDLQSLRSEHAATSGVGVLIVGGSQGAHAINMALVEAASRLAHLGQPLRITHQTGERDLDAVRAGYAAVGLAADVEPFLHDMARRMGAADLVVCRAGATTLAELTAAGKPSILVPLPTATDDHQRKNAELLATAGAADVVLQSERLSLDLVERIAALAGDPVRRQAMAAAARRLARPNAAQMVVDRALALVSR